MSGQKLTIKNAAIILSLIAVVLLVIYFAVFNINAITKVDFKNCDFSVDISQ